MKGINSREPREPSENEVKSDVNYKAGGTIWRRLFLTVARRSVNEFAKNVILRAYGRGVIDSGQLHYLAGMIDRQLWPERHKRPTTTE